jgi:rubredoxin/mono/diheme cytochrome c family protein
MARYICSVCGYVHDESQADAWDNLPADWTCPVCGATKAQFESSGTATVEPDPSAEVAPSTEVTPSAARPTNRVLQSHRLFGYLFVGIYVLLLVQMIPRLWGYQIEFPPRTVLHFGLGLAVGVVLLLKIAIVRFFRRLDQSLVPMLGTFILVASVVLIGVSVPFAFQEALATGRLLTEENLARVETLLAQTGLEPERCADLASADSLRAGQRVLRRECVQCHDLRTVLAKPRTPANWRQTVKRMADRTTMLEPLGETQQWQVTAYLVALSPQLQRSVQQLREQQQQRDTTSPPNVAAGSNTPEPAAYDAAMAKGLFEAKCAQCHETSLVTDAPPGTGQEARQLVQRMVEEGLEATAPELDQITRYLTETFTKPGE